MRVADLCAIQTGYTARKRLQPVLQGGAPAIQLRDVATDGEVNPDTLIRVELGELPDRYFVRAGIATSHRHWTNAWQSLPLRFFP